MVEEEEEEEERFEGGWQIFICWLPHLPFALARTHVIDVVSSYHDDFNRPLWSYQLTYLAGSQVVRRREARIGSDDIQISLNQPD